jgi:hypothetical protein
MVDNNCVYCAQDTSFGSGKFVNRLAHDDGYACAECAGYVCDRCDEQIYLDEDITANKCGSGYGPWDDEFADGAVHVCRSCLTINEWRALKNFEKYNSNRLDRSYYFNVFMYLTNTEDNSIMGDVREQVRVLSWKALDDGHHELYREMREWLNENDGSIRY